MGSGTMSSNCGWQHSEKNATVAAYSHMELAADRKRALQYLADHVEALAAGMNVIPLRAA
jgi:hypothetical protein